MACNCKKNKSVSVKPQIKQETEQKENVNK